MRQLHMAEELLITTLEMDSPEQLNRKLTSPKPIEFSLVEGRATDNELRRMLDGIGRPYGWSECRWSEQRWQEWLGSKRLRWFINVDDVRAGLLEIEDHAADGTEIVYFGFLPPFVGKGYGGSALTNAVELAWQIELAKAHPKCVWLHTASRDDANALPAYLRRGFRLVKQEIAMTD
jgi:GNAT superfamily N-acetyltransferase